MLADLGSPLALGPASGVLFVGQLGKYLPGSVWTVVVQAEVASRLGVPRKRTAVVGLLSVLLSALAGLAVGVLAELVALWTFPPLLRRFQLPSLLAASCGATAVRWWLVSRAHGATALVLLQLFHAASFGLWWACAVEAMGRLVPVGLRATGQALFSALVFGAGNAVGYGLCGEGYQRFGSVSPLFAIAAAAELCTLPLCALAARYVGAAHGAPSTAREGGTPPGSA
jgi:hypothetical protein